MPSAPARIAAEIAFLVLVAGGLALAEFDPVVIGVVLVVAVLLVALFEGAARAVTRDRDPEVSPLAEEPTYVEQVEVEERAAKPEPTPEPTVSERSARAILASAPPPLPPDRPKPKPKLTPRRFVRREPPPAPPPPEPEPEPVAVAREWNLWELQRAVRDASDDEHHEEWTALLIHLREFADPAGNLPLEFQALVQESFAPILEPEPAGAT